MKMRKVLAALAAAAVATTAMATVASAADYNAYIVFQTTQYSFRNGWSDAGYGAATPYHADKYIVWGAGDYPEETYPQYEDNFDYDINGYALPATYVDTVVDSSRKIQTKGQAASLVTRILSSTSKKPTLPVVWPSILTTLIVISPRSNMSL